MGIIDYLVKVSSYLPEIKSPEKEVPFKSKMIFTAIVLLLFFILSQIWCIGISQSSAEQISIYQTLLASQIGTLLTAGIGPIVMAAILLQLLVGAKILDINLGDPTGKSKFMALQKLLAVALCFIEGFVFVFSGFLAPIGGTTLGNPVLWFVILQVALGSLILLYLDEIVSKWGIGSGVSLFIAAGVTGSLFWQLFRPEMFTLLGEKLTGGYLWQIFAAQQWFLIFPILGVIAIFLIVVFAEGMHINIPITMGHRGTGGRYPVKFLYVSNMPVILAMALFANIRIWSVFLKDVPILGMISEGFSWVVQTPNVEGMSLVQGFFLQGITSITLLALAQGILFLIILIGACIIFGWFWVEMGNQSTEAVANQLHRQGMQIPGFRKDKRIIEKVLGRYIPPITILGSIFVALLAGLGDFVLSGLASGTGILLTVGIIYRFYEEIAKSQADLLSRFLGKN